MFTVVLFRKAQISTLLYPVMIKKPRQALSKFDSLQESVVLGMSFSVDIWHLN